jgi:acetoacetate decarboxylase
LLSLLHLDRANPIVGGREFYGWPKKEAEEVLFRDTGTSISAAVTRYGQRIISVGLEVEQKVVPVPERHANPIYFVKLIPSVRQHGPPDVLKLNSTVITPDVITELRVGKGHLEFGGSPYDPFLASIPIREVVYSEAVVHDFTLGYGEVVVDYLAEPTA